MPDQEPLEPGVPEQTEAPAKSKSHMMPLMGGVIVFVLFTIIFSLKFGVFSSNNVVVPVPADSQAVATDEAANATHADASASDDDPYSELFDGFDGTYEEEDLTDSAQVKDSLEKVDWYETKKAEIDRKMVQMQNEQTQLEALRDQVETLLDRKESMEQGNIETMAKLYEGMDAEELVPILSNLEDAQVSVIISKMKKQKASEVLGKMDPARAAKITKYIISMNN